MSAHYEILPIDNASPGECPALRLTRTLAADDPLNYSHRALDAGMIVYRFDGATCGCVAPGGIACSDEPGANPFYELPRGAVELAFLEPASSQEAPKA